MYTFYFQSLGKDESKLVAVKSKMPPFITPLGSKVGGYDIAQILSCGYRVVIQPEKWSQEELEAAWGDEDQPLRMFYAKGYRGPDSKAETFRDIDDPATSEYLKFVDYANGGSVPDWCSEDYGQERASVPEPSPENLQESAQNAIPQIGPLPPMASLAPTSVISAPVGNSYTMTWTYSDYTPWSKEHGTLPSPEAPVPPEGSMLLPPLKTQYVDVTDFACDSVNWQDRRIEQLIQESTKPGTVVQYIEKPSWWAMLKNWVNMDF